jgi:hypothetical protein
MRSKCATSTTCLLTLTPIRTTLIHRRPLRHHLPPSYERLMRHPVTPPAPPLHSTVGPWVPPPPPRTPDLDPNTPGSTDPKPVVQVAYLKPERGHTVASVAGECPNKQ